MQVGCRGWWVYLTAVYNTKKDTQIGPFRRWGVARYAVEEGEWAQAGAQTQRPSLPTLPIDSAAATAAAAFVGL